jgi:hypothetical protein
VSEWRDTLLGAVKGPRLSCATTLSRLAPLPHEACHLPIESYQLQAGTVI